MGNSYILLDNAVLEHNSQIATELESNSLSLFRGLPDDYLEAVAPMLFRFEDSSKLRSWFYEEGWGKSWGVFFVTSFDFEQTYNHFRKFLMVKTEDDQQLYFRFYDPRVLRIFLPTCDEKQLKEFFGPVEHFICEDEDPDFALVFSFEKNVLKTERIPSTSLFETGEQKNQGRKFFV